MKLTQISVDCSSHSQEEMIRNSFTESTWLSLKTRIEKENKNDTNLVDRNLTVYLWIINSFQQHFFSFIIQKDHE